MMTIYLTILLSSFLITLMGTPLSILIARRVKLLDIPGRDPLKIHRQPIPLLGGLGITSAIYLSLLAASQHFVSAHSAMLSLGIALSMIFTIGLIDDYRDLSPKMRLAGQLLAGAVFIFGGQFSVNLFQNQVLNSIITIFYLVAATNAMNLLDGIDGLATGTALVASLGFLFGFAIFNNGMGLILSLGCIGASAGFLFYNFNPARIFLGDNGSTVLGFLLGAMAVIFSSNLTSLSYFMFPVLILIVPIFDTTIAILRRLKKGKPVFLGDREHFYDYLIRKEFTQKQTTVLMCAIGMCGALAGFFII